MRRRNPPDAGLWGYPGGKIERGETIIAAALRELHEETGTCARALHLFPPLDIIGHDPDGRSTTHFILLPVLCEWTSGTPAAASDALDAAWFEASHIRTRQAELSSHVLELADAALAWSRDDLS